MKALKIIFPLLASAILASCGGGGGGTSNAFTGAGNDTTLSLSATAVTLPVSPFTVGEEQTSPFPGNFLGSPFISEVTVTWRHKDGSLISGTTQVNVATSPTTILSFSTLNAVNGGSGNDQFHTLLGSGPVDVTAGTGTIYVHAGQQPGTGVVTVTAVDPVSHQNIAAQLSITVVGASTGVPASISVSAAQGVYIASSGGPQSTTLTAVVRDGSGAFVSSPGAVDNVQFRIVGPANTDATLVATNAAGSQSSGSTVVAVTHNGIAQATFRSGAQLGTVQIQATADRGDNNVDNGIQDAVSANATVVVSDGKLNSLTLTSPGTNAPSILINRVSTGVTLIDQSDNPLPPDPNATYSFTISAHATDHEGNPVLPGTQIKFGVIDTPVDANGNFLISGVHGDPQEGGNLFTATDGHFRTAGGGVFINDTLLVFGKAVLGNDDLESASRVTQINGETSLTVATPFNLNDGTGATVNYGPVLPYIVGRAGIGNITSPAFTDANGTASTTLNYPVSQLGHVAAIWAQGTGTDEINHQTTRIITDINLIAFPGVADAIITVSPNPIPGNITTTVFACITDKLGSPIQGVQFQFAFSNLGVGTGKLDNIVGGGTVPDLTDASGCVATTVSTAGIASSGSGGSTNSPTLTFSAGKASGSAPITANGGLVLLAIPSQLGGNGGTVTLQLLSSNGTPVPGVQLTGTCTGDASIGIVSGPGVTDAQGKTTTTITANLDIPKAAGSGSCTFTTSTGSPTATVRLQGLDPCTIPVSPPNPACS
jgi:hypothetical protein